VCLLVTEAPQFEIQDDMGVGTGIETPDRWKLALPAPIASPEELVDPELANITARLRTIFQTPLTNTELDDLTSFVVHKLLLLPSGPPLFECLRLGLVLSMLIAHGTTYYSHDAFVITILSKIRCQLELLYPTAHSEPAFHVWILLTCMAAAPPYLPDQREWFREQASALCQPWDETVAAMRGILWIETSEAIFHRQWHDAVTSWNIGV
jgi:hypothetical protein